MSRYIDADAYLKKAQYEAQAMPNDCRFADYTGWLLDKTPTIKTKQIKYFDEDEKVWKIGAVIIDSAEG